MKKALTISMCVCALIVLIGMERRLETGPKSESEIQEELRNQEEKQRADEKKLRDERGREDDLRKEQREAEARLEQAATNYGPDSKQYKLISDRMATRDVEITDAATNQKAIQKDLGSTEKEITALTQQLQSLREKSERKVQSTFAAEMEQRLSFKNPDEVDAILQNEFDFLQKKSYEDQPSFLEELQKIAKERGMNKLSSDIGSRIDELNRFASALKLTARNETERRLNLENKITSDQISSIREDIDNQISIIADAQKTKDDVAIQKALKTLRELNAATKYYLDSAASISMAVETKQVQLNELIEIGLKAFQEVPRLPDELANYEKELISVAQDTAKTEEVIEVFAIPESIQKLGPILVQVAVDYNPFPERLEKTGLTLQKYSAYIQKFADVMASSPEIVDGVASATEKADGYFAKAKPWVELIPGKFGRSIFGKMEGGQKITKIFKDNKKWVSDKANFAKEYIAPFATAIANIGKGIGDFAAEAQTTFELKQIEKARLLIEQERIRIATDAENQTIGSSIGAPSEKRTKLAEFFKPFTDFFKNVGDYVKNIFASKKPTLDLAQSNYDSAQKNYLKILGFAENEQPSVKEVKERLRTLQQDSSKQLALQEATRNLTKAVTDIETNYKDIIKQLNAITANLAFLVDAWDSVQTNEQKMDLASWVEMSIDARNQRMAFLQALEHGVENLRQDLSLLKGTPQGNMMTQFTDGLARMVAGGMINAIADSNAQLQTADRFLKQAEAQVNESFGQPPE